MTMFDLPVERTPDRIDLIRTWVPRVVMAMFFVSMGSQKFTDRYWMEVFATIGVGDWLRYATGIVQVGGALLLLVPYTALIGAGMLAITMVGAMLAWIFFLGSPGSAIIPGAILAMLAALAANARRRIHLRAPFANRYGGQA
jgi:putative oxidoreductase